MSKSSTGAGADGALAAKDAYALMAAARPAALIAALKHPDFAMVAAVALAGFRLDAKSLDNPLVRKRLAAEAARNADFAAKLRELAAAGRTSDPVPAENSRGPAPKQAAVPSPSPVARPSAPPTLPADTRASADTRLIIEKFRAERERLKKELAAESDRRREVERELAEAKLARLAAETAKAGLVREELRLRQKAERLERKLHRAAFETEQLRRIVATSYMAPSSSSRPAAPADSSPATAREDAAESPFVIAVRHLLDKQKWPAARALAEDVLRQDPSDENALSIHAAACDGMGDRKAAVSDLRALVEIRTGRAAYAAALQTLAQLLAKSPLPEREGPGVGSPSPLRGGSGVGSEARLARDLFAGAATAGGAAANEGLRQILAGLAVTAPAVFEFLRQAAVAAGSGAFFAPRKSGQAGADEVLSIPLPAGLPRSVTPRLAAGWVDANASALVGALRAALSDVDESVRSRLAAGLVAATGNDGSYFRMLTRKSLIGPVIVDASNAAWSGQEMVANPRPRLANLIALRRALRDKGYFPIFLIADANLPYVVEDQGAARQMVADGHLILAPGGTDADELILREARRLHAPVITNDYMTDWDPDEQVEKLQYTVSPGSGEATVYTKAG